MDELLSFLGWYVLFTILAAMAITIIIGIPCVLIVMFYDLFNNRK